MGSATKPDSSSGESQTTSLLNSHEKKGVYMDLKTTFLRAKERLNDIKRSQAERSGFYLLEDQVQEWKLQSTVLFPTEQAVLSKQILSKN